MVLYWATRKFSVSVLVGLTSNSIIKESRGGGAIASTPFPSLPFPELLFEWTVGVRPGGGGGGGGCWSAGRLVSFSPWLSSVFILQFLMVDSQANHHYNIITKVSGQGRRIRGLRRGRGRGAKGCHTLAFKLFLYCHLLVLNGKYMICNFRYKAIRL